MLLIPLADKENIYMAWTIVIIHATYGAIYCAVFATCLNKCLSLHLSGIGIGISCFMNDFAQFFFPLINGYFMGRSAEKKDVYKCCYFLSGIAGLGFVGSIF